MFGAIGGATGEPVVVNYGSLLGLAAAYAYVAWRDRRPGFAAWAVVIAAAPLVLYLLGMENPARIAALALGGNLVIEGFRERNKAPL